jgi:hypothetical protein
MLRRVDALLLDDRIRPVLSIALGLAVALAFLGGFRMPGLWSTNYYIPSIFDGFWRRSLLGTLLSPLGDLRFDYAFLAALQFAVLLALLVLLIRRALAGPPRLTVLVVLFLAGPAGAYLFHEVGYVEQVLYLLLVGAVAVRDPRSGGLLMVAALFVHEMAAFTVIPIWLAHLVVVQDRDGAAVRQALVCAVVFGVIYVFFQEAAASDIDRLLDRIRSAAGYQPRVDYYEVFRHALTGPRQQNYFHRAFAYKLAMVLAIAVLAALPFLRARLSWRAVADGLCVLAACAAPLLLGLFGWDTQRWIFLAFGSSLCALLLFERAGSGWTWWPIALCLALFAVRGSFGYFDGLARRSLFDLPAFLGELPRLVDRVPAL